MPSKFPMNDPQNIWKNQPTEPFVLSATELCREAQQYERKACFEALYSIAVGLALFAFFARGSVQPYDLVSRTGLGLLSLWGIDYAYQSYKWIWPRRLMPDAALNTTLQSYRCELEKHRDYGRHLWRRAGLTFCFVGAAMFMVPALIKSLQNRQLLLNTLPVFVLLAVWLAVFLRLRKRNRGKLQQEIEELRALETQK